MALMGPRSFHDASAAAAAADVITRRRYNSAVAWLQIKPELCKRCLQASKIHFCIYKM